MTVSITAIFRGSSPGDGTGDTAYDGAGIINTNFTNLKTAVESLQGRHWTVQNTSTTVAVGGRYKANNHAGITLTMPATFAQSTSAESDIWIMNDDDASNITLTPGSGDAFYVNGATNGIDTTYALPPGTTAIISPRTTNSEWDLFLVGSIQNNAVTFAKIQDITSDRLIGRDTASSGDPEEITVSNGLEWTGSGGIQRSALTGDVTASAGSNSTTIANNVVTYAKMQQAAAGYSIMAKVGTGGGNYAALTAGTDSVLRRSGSGDLAFGTIVTNNIAANAVTLAKMAQVATGTVFYRKTAATGDPEVQTLATLKTDLGLTGTNSGDQTITLTGPVSGSGTGSFATTVNVTAISGQTDIGAALAGTDQFLVNDGGAIRRTDVSRVATYCATNMSNVAVTGTITATGDITAFYTSDMALKHNIEPISGALEKVMNLRGSRYEYNDREGVYYGLMAQDMQGVMPELVHRNADGALTIRMAGFELVALLVEAIKELKGKLDDHTNQRSD